MKKLLQIVPIVFIFVGAVLLFEQPAYAYADPGTGLLAIQAAGSMLIATGWYLRRKIYTLLHRGEAIKPSVEEFPAAKDNEDTFLP